MDSERFTNGYRQTEIIQNKNFSFETFRVRSNLRSLTYEFFFSSKQIKKSISLTIIENGYGHDDAVYHMLIDSVLKENLEKVNHLGILVSSSNLIIFSSFLKIVRKN
jgi:hypothetical protein